jgi:hypothetical protein
MAKKNLVGYYIKAKNNDKWAYPVYEITGISYSFNTPFYRITHDHHWTIVPIDELIEDFDFLPKLKALLLWSLEN